MRVGKQILAMIELNSENLSTWKACDWMASCGKWVFQVQRLSRGEMRLTLPSLCPCLSRFPFLCVSLRIREEQLKINTRGARGASPAVRPGWYFYSSRKGNCRRQTYRTTRLCDLPLAPPALPMDHGFSSGCGCLARVPDNQHLLLICENWLPALAWSPFVSSGANRPSEVSFSPAPLGPLAAGSTAQSLQLTLLSLLAQQPSVESPTASTITSDRFFFSATPARTTTIVAKTI